MMGPKPVDERFDHDLCRTELVNPAAPFPKIRLQGPQCRRAAPRRLCHRCGRPTTAVRLLRWVRCILRGKPRGKPYQSWPGFPRTATNKRSG